ncbi:primosomal protein N' [Algicella marina]|uniref:Replication restart protein PriA n=1 Tax=Algicella marina TaxID=2683284 RepID=A0A6P1SVD7_9RHOB|nr:primosomal protein N' [Algicella marina]QHQ33737.1 primosomal protein N' [Algicella marina]
MTETHFAQGALISVLTSEPLDRFLDYRAPEGGVQLGSFVRVPLGPRRVLGVVWGPGAGDFDIARIRPVHAVLDVPPMAEAMRAFLTRAAEYTLTPLEAMLRLATRVPDLGAPPGMRKVLRRGVGEPDRLTDARARVLEVLESGGVFAPGELSALAGVSASVISGLEKQGVVDRVAAPRDAPFDILQPDLRGKELNEDQQRAATALREAVRSGAYGTTLLKGVTGSGKTEVYLEAVAEALRAGRQALVLLPEIALTGAFLERVEARFGARPAEWHSGVTQADRRRCWRGVTSGEARLVVGARSALFLPFRDLGLIVVDEEHDTSYKQEDGVLYHARDMAVLRASMTSAAVVLASATPALESWANARAGKYARLDLTERFGVAEMPEMAALDLRSDRPEPGRWVAEGLRAATQARLAANEQVLWFLNRRGYAPVTQCRACGEQIGCHECDARMVEHRFRKILMCHQCGAERAVPTACPACGKEGMMAAIGPGVERLAEEALALFPEAQVEILSSDQTESARALKARIDAIAAGGADIIIGTQIVAKGHNFPNLTLVGVIDADLGLQGGDLRASERTFQLVRQVAGRAGRAERRGSALIQTCVPDHPVIAAILSGDEEEFWAAEAAAREAAGVPPYGRMAGVIVSGPDEARVVDVARELGRRSDMLLAEGAQVFGPAAAQIARIRGKFRYRLLVKAPKGRVIQPALSKWRASVKLPPNVRVVLDIDPQSFF